MTLTKPDLNKPAFQLNWYWRELILADRCPMCGADIKEENFTSELSKKEYSISAMCQKCQDKVFKQPYNVEETSNDLFVEISDLEAGLRKFCYCGKQLIVSELKANIISVDYNGDDIAGWNCKCVACRRDILLIND